MKHSIYWFLLSSGIVGTSSLGFSAAEEKTLTSANSYDGNTASAEFQTQDNTSSNGTNYTCMGDVCISYAGKQTPLTNSCFNQSAGDLSFVGNGYSLCFDNVKATSKPSVIEVGGTGKNLSLSGLSLFSCTSCPPGTTGNGAIKSSGSTTLSNDAKLMFDRNCSTDNGGAITCKGCTIQNTSGSAIFINNSSAKNGGAISSTAAMTVSSNNQVMFSGNSTTGSSSSSGGAIWCSDTSSNNLDLKFEGNKELIFSGNSSTTSGGAIYADKLTIVTGGPTLFTRNSVKSTSSPKGGAISINDTNGECSLTAELGDLVFDGNTITDSSSTKRNAIDLGTSGKFTTLNAREGYGIYFYDPISNTGTTTGDIELNKTSGNNTYTGQIVFSGEKLSEAEKKVADNLKSYFKQPLKVTAGSLVLRDGVTLEAKKVEQTAGSAVVMDLGTTLQTPSTGGETITLENLEINVASLGGGGTPAKTSSQTTSQNVTINNVNLVDSDGNAYEQPVFSTTTPFSALSVSTNTGQITIPTTNLTDFIPAAHYGYQGNWTVTWSQAANAATNSTTLSWQQTGYNPNPERVGALVPNTLWGAFADIRALQNLMDVSIQGADYHRGFWVSGIASFLHRSGTPTQRKFRHSGAGYALGILATTPTEDIFSAAFCQLFGRDKDYLVSKNKSDVYAGSVYYQHISFWDVWNQLLQNMLGTQAPLVLNAQLAYSHASNEMKTNMTTTYAPNNTVYPEIRGEWSNDCFAVELGAKTPIEFQTWRFFDSYSPFLKFQLVYAHQEDFKENNSSEGRYFESSHLTNLAMPLGVKFERFSDENQASYDLTLAYSPDLVRSNPDCLVSLLVSPTTGVWTTYGTNLARQAFIVQAGTHLAPTPSMEIFSQFGFELRGSSRNYTVDLGTKFQF
ncbi:autotransporter domain-containing protein [Chlamydia gallinacea]|uniref:autotransporter domain-containing protein n=2 Tax=Chlamydia gallinacea TaxID=1457153 RepID=UPI0024E1AA43|nr:autotransporter domain-containing protein [Chlamydia gallinacea]